MTLMHVNMCPSVSRCMNASASVRAPRHGKVPARIYLFQTMSMIHTPLVVAAGMCRGFAEALAVYPLFFSPPNSNAVSPIHRIGQAVERSLLNVIPIQSTCRHSVQHNVRFLFSSERGLQSHPSPSSARASRPKERILTVETIDCLFRRLGKP